MPRPQKCRKICCYPDHWSFAPDSEQAAETISLTLDEYETIRLIDYENMTQEQCASAMEVARTTITAIYDSARKKIADAIINGKRLVISGGNYRLDTAFKANIRSKGSIAMRVAVTYENGEVFQHFGRTPQFKVYDIENKAVVGSQVIDTNGTGHGALAGFLKSMQADVLICGGIGGGAQMAMQEAGINLFAGNMGNADDVVNAYIAGTLDQNAAPTCDHHHHEDGHDCGDHGCGTHVCGNH